MIPPAESHPPLFAEVHNSGFAYAMRFVRGRYRERERVFGGIHEPEDTTFSPGPAMRYAKVDPRRVRVYHGVHRLGTWRLLGAKIVAWWDLPIVVRSNRVDALRPGGRLRRLPLEGNGLITALPGHSGALFALYSTTTHWRVVRIAQGSARATSWTKGQATDCTATPTRLFIAIGTPGGAYKEYGAQGPGALWSYAFTTGAIRKEREFDRYAQLVFDDPWVHSGHVASLMRWRPDPDPSARWFPYQTEILALDGSVRTLDVVATGWEVHTFDPKRRMFLELHIDRNSMGFDLRRVSLATGAQGEVEDDVDAVDVSTGSPYSPVVKG